MTDIQSMEMAKHSKLAIQTAYKVGFSVNTVQKAILSR